MIFGECPYCDEPVSTPCADKTPAFSREECPSCFKIYWLRHSRIDPVSYTLEGFDAEYVIDEENMQINKREASNGA